MSKIPVLLMARELHIGGSERQMTETAIALDRAEFEPHIGCFRASGMRGDELLQAGVPVVQFPVHSYRSTVAVTQARAIARYVQRNGIRIVHTWDYPLNVYAIPVAHFLTRAVAISSQRFHRELMPKGYLGLTHLADRWSDAMVVNCEFLRRHLIEDERVPASKVHVCYNGIDLDRFRRVPSPPQALTVGTVCGLRPEKDLKTLIAGFARARTTAPEMKLAIVGSGSELAILQQYAREANVAEAVHFEPATPNVTAWLSRMDIFVLPSRSEAFSNSLMEAMACGCCPVASNVGGNPELVKPEQTGVLFKSGDPGELGAALRRLVEEPELRNSLAERAREFVHTNFSNAAAATRMAEIYRLAIDANRA